MAETKKIKTALVSVFHKDGLDELLANIFFYHTTKRPAFLQDVSKICYKGLGLSSPSRRNQNARTCTDGLLPSPI